MCVYGVFVMDACLWCVCGALGVIVSAVTLILTFTLTLTLTFTLTLTRGEECVREVEG